MALIAAVEGAHAAEGSLAAAPGAEPTFSGAARCGGLFVADSPSPAGATGLELARFDAGSLLAQRVIERAWGPENDSLDLRKRAAGWKSEPFAFASSAILPGAGQTYIGEGSGFWFALAEAAGWTARWFFQRDRDRDRDKAAQIAGDPADSTSGWSFSRWQARDPSRDVAQLEALWTSDRAAFYSLIASDPSYLDGWDGADPSATRTSFEHQRDLGDKAAQRQRWSEVGVGLNHLIAAVDALRAARLHNLPVRRNLDLALRARWSHHGPALVAALERRF